MALVRALFKQYPGRSVIGGIAAITFGVNAQGRSLEDVARPLSVIAKPSEAIFRSGGEGQPGPTTG